MAEGGSYLRFSELNSDSRNLRNCSLPTGSFKTSSMPKAHLFTLCWLGSLLLNTQEQGLNTVTPPQRARHTPGFKLPQRGVIGDPRVGRVRRGEERVVVQVLLRVSQQTGLERPPRSENTHVSLQLLSRNFKEAKRGILSGGHVEVTWRTQRLSCTTDAH